MNQMFGKSIKIVTPDNVEVDYKLASLGVRAAAIGIDYLIKDSVFFIAFIIAVFIMRKYEDLETIYMVLGIMLLVRFILSNFYFIICDIVMKGQTIGKRLMHIRIIRENGEGITLKHILIREFVKAVIDSLGLGVIMIFFNKKYKRLGDMMASTIVVEEESAVLSYKDFKYGENKYQLSEEETNLITDFLERRPMLEERHCTRLQENLINHFIEKLDIDKQTVDKKVFLQSLID